MDRLIGTVLLWLGLTMAASAQEVVVYYHTDALGTPVAVTDEHGDVIERSEYEPYGLLLNRQLEDGPGFTGHVSDAATGLSYMQQRYYDPMLGVMLSVDPLTAYEKPFTNFCRYCYARNNPYRFTDPDGRNGVTALGGVITESWNALNGRGFDGEMVWGALKDGYNGEGDGLARAAFDDAMTFVPWGKVTSIGRFGGLLKDSARGLGASAGEIRAGGKALVSMLRKSEGFSESTIGRSVANMDVALGAGAAKGALADAGFKAGTVSGGKQSFTNGSVRFTFSTSKGGVPSIYLSVKGKEILKIRLVEPQ